MRKTFFWQLGHRVWRIILVTTWRAHKGKSFFNFNEINVYFDIFCLHVTGYLNIKYLFPICMFVVMASGNCELHTYFTFLQRILTSTQMKKFNIFCIIYVAMSNIHFSRLDNVKMTCITQVSFKITIRKTCLHWYSLTLKMKPVFQLAIWENERSKIIFLPSFQLVTRLNSQNKWNKFINELWYINLYMNISISNWHNSSFDYTKMKFFYFISVPFTITDLQPL